jgi:Domain of unknown function (DUF4062)
MASYRRVLSVFLASPNDVSAERLAARGVVLELTLPARELGVSLELLGWEDTLPGAARPQEVINKDLDKADLFVGLLWRRWGQPTGHPKYSSGFEEEFYRARQRREQSGTPEMWLFFKDVEPAVRQDPGEQLQKVLQFKNACISEKQILFKEFGTTEEWANLLRNDLLLHLLRLNKSGSNEPAGDGLPLDGLQPGRSRSEAAVIVQAEVTTSPSLLPLSDVLRDLAVGANPQSYATQHGGLFSARLYLIGLALLAESQTSSGLVGTHEINTLYRLRNEFEPLAIERALLSRTILADRADVKPGWYWFSQEPSVQHNLLFSYALSDDDYEVRKGAFAELTRGSVVRDDWTAALFSANTAEAQPLQVQSAYWAYLVAIVAPVHRNLLERMQGSEANREQVADLLRIIRIVSEPNAVLAEVATAPKPPSSRLAVELRVNIDRIDQAVLVAAFSSRHDIVRELIAVELARRHLFDDVRPAAQRDTLESIRVLEYRDRLQLAPAGSEPPPLPNDLSYENSKALGLERIQNLSYDQLSSRIEWFNIDGPPAYEALAIKYWDRFANQCRSDIADCFGRVRQQSIDRRVQLLVDSGRSEADAVELVVHGDLKLDDKLDSFIRRLFGAAALGAIAQHGSKEDATFVRPFLATSLERDAAIEALARVGDLTDVPALVRLATESYAETQRLAARVAIQLSEGSDDVLRALIASNEPVPVRLALEQAGRRGHDSLKAMAAGLLNSGNASIREIGAETIISLLDKVQLTALLESYVSQTPYYYNVVVAFDEALYCQTLDT